MDNRITTRRKKFPTDCRACQLGTCVSIGDTLIKRDRNTQHTCFCLFLLTFATVNFENSAEVHKNYTFTLLSETEGTAIKEIE